MESSSIFFILVVSASSVLSENGMFQGDIVLTPDQKNVFENKGASGYGASKAVRNWGKVIPYVFDTSIAYSGTAVQAINAAIADYHTYTCLRFVRRTNEINYIRFFAGDGCYSYVGMNGGKQDLSLGNGCWNKGIASHEMMHALGFFHEQSRPDRDGYVKILLQNIDPSMRYNFDKMSTSEFQDLSSPYDLDSVMHYGQYDFSTSYGRLRTIETVNPVNQNRIGQRRGLSVEDINQINKKYGC